jgi:membrane-associated phospholipid phosphatase
MTSTPPRLLSINQRNQLARVITEITAPAVCVVVGLVTVAWHSANQGIDAAWAGLAILFCAGVPLAYVVKGVKAGKWSDHHISRREQRALPLLVALGSVAAASALLIVVGAPRELIALVLSQLAGLVVMLVISRFWKVSIHCATAGGLVGVLVVLFGLWALLGLIPLALVAWSRVVLDAHTWAQVTVGALLGFLIGSTLFPLLS